MAERFRIRSEGDLEAITVAETYRLLSEVFGPYCFNVSGAPRDQQAVFQSYAHHILFVTYIHELIADSTDIAEPGMQMPRNLSLLDAGVWVIDRYPEEAESAGWDVPAHELQQWLARPTRIRFWSGNLWRHLGFEVPFERIFSAHANLLKHGLLKLGSEIGRLQAQCAHSGIELTEAQAVAALPEYSAHLQGMMEYHATEIAEVVGRYFHGLYRFVRARWLLTPTNHLDRIGVPAGITDDAVRYLYASTLHSFSNWAEQRIVDSIPETSRNFKPLYPQHEDPDPANG